jgi:hypothetical protein
MKHFTDEAWFDFARRLLPPEEMSRMHAHLRSGCEKCLALFKLWDAVSETARRESDYEFYGSAVDAAKARYGERWWKPAPPPGAPMAMLVFDSFADAGAAVGIRSIFSGPRHLLYRLGPLTVDLCLRDDVGGGTMIAGQVLVTSAGGSSAGRGDVSLMRGETTIARTSTNEFGEFQIGSDGGADLRVRLDILGQQPAIVALPG